MVWVRWLGSVLVLLTAAVLAVSLAASPAPQLPIPVVLVGIAPPEAPPATGAVVVLPPVVDLADPVDGEGTSDGEDVGGEDIDNDDSDGDSSATPPNSDQNGPGGGADDPADPDDDDGDPDDDDGDSDDDDGDSDDDDGDPAG